MNSEDRNSEGYVTGNACAKKILEYLKHRKTATNYQIAVAVGKNAQEIQSELDALVEFRIIKHSEDTALESSVYLITGYGHQFTTKFFQRRKNP